MNAERHKTFINLKNIVSISRGDSGRMLKYLKQFQELIPERLEQLKDALAENDRRQIRQILHKMSPQLQFFGIQDVVNPIQRLEMEYESMPLFELNVLVNDLIYKLEGAISEVTKTIQTQFE
ncbi:Hpt domain-containing protein [Formosa maritima]|uniref:Hpt domain-containing protein n=1 Tax=Formosa maritima TaxID=2592046 RepID=A0A5D0GAC0_9FLAO|nr:Hpt domain-containing protein [Formosa maritima]TYA54772.1 Hpt domain-containing protein [Formosa maritima]